MYGSMTGFSLSNPLGSVSAALPRLKMKENCTLQSTSDSEHEI